MMQFSSPAAATFTMLDEHARRLIEMMGHSPGTRGALAPEDVAPALARLRSALAQVPAPQPTAEEQEPDAPQQTVGLKQRAFPLLDMLEQAAKKKKPVLWGI